jgi:hypothetical protein
MSVPLPSVRDMEEREDNLVIDCDRCEVRGRACPTCMVSVLLGAPPPVEWDEDEQRAISALVEGGMIPRLRLIAPRPRRGMTEPRRRAG